MQKNRMHAGRSAMRAVGRRHNGGRRGLELENENAISLLFKDLFRNSIYDLRNRQFAARTLRTSP